MPCRVDPGPHEIARSELNEDASRLNEWLDGKLETDHSKLDPTGKLCTAIKSLGEEEFLELMVKHIKEPQARQLIGWWEEHKVYDRRWGR